MAEAAATTASGQIDWLERVNSLSKRKDIYFAVGIIAILVVLILPLPSFLLDFLLGVSITLSVIILMTVLFVEKPLHMSSFFF